MKITTADEMRTIDRVTTDRHGVSSLELMENAGTAVATFAREHWPKAVRVVVLCGKGNNGGDGFVAARRLHMTGRVVEVILLADPAELKGDAAAMFANLPIRPIVLRGDGDLQREKTRSLAGADLIIDAVLGTGFKPPVKGLTSEVIAAVSQMRTPVLAVDIPSGADADADHTTKSLVMRADAIVTFTAARPAHLFNLLTSGPVVIAPIGSPDEAIRTQLPMEVITPREVAPLIAPRPLDAEKNQFGRVLVVGGSIGKAGAAAMAGMGALRAGAGLVTVAVPRSVLPTVASFAPEMMTEPLSETEAGTISSRALEYEAFDKIARAKSVIAVGPGISTNEETRQFVHEVVTRGEQPMVLDADAINAFDGVDDAKKLKALQRTVVLTPHIREFARLSKETEAEAKETRWRRAQRFAIQNKVIVVLKGHPTVIALPDGKIWLNPTGNPGMASGGMGDVLTGMIAGFIAQQPADITAAVCAAVYLHGLAGDVAREEMGEPTLIATDVLRSLHEAMRRARQWSEDRLLRIC